MERAWTTRIPVPFFVGEAGVDLGVQGHYYIAEEQYMSGRKFTNLDRARLERVAGMFDALSEATRLQILQALQGGALAVGEIVERLGAKQANISKQLGILHQAGLVERERNGTMVRYFISEPMIFDLCGLVCAKLQRDAEEQAKAFS